MGCKAGRFILTMEKIFNRILPSVNEEACEFFFVRGKKRDLDAFSMEGERLGILLNVPRCLGSFESELYILDDYCNEIISVKFKRIFSSDIFEKYICTHYQFFFVF